MLALLPLLLLACSEHSIFIPPDSTGSASPGSIAGRVCDPSGRTWLPDAQVYTNIYTDDNALYDTRLAYSDREGFWLLDQLPPFFTYKVYIQYGNEMLDTEQVYVDDGTDVVLPEPECFDPLQVNVAIVTGDFDDFQLVLTNMGFANYTLIDGLTDTDLTDFLMSAPDMEFYDIIFFNGGHLEEDVIYDSDGTDLAGDTATIRQNIKSYVENGGAIYASDWAYDVVEQIWPDRLDFVGDDSTPDDAQKGEYDFVNAAVSDASLAEFVDKDFVEIEFDLPVWPPIMNADDSVSVHLTGDVTYREGTSTYAKPTSPLLISFTAGEGKVVFSTFRVAKNATDDMMKALQYMMYSL